MVLNLRSFKLIAVAASTALLTFSTVLVAAPAYASSTPPVGEIPSWTSVSPGPSDLTTKRAEAPTGLNTTPGTYAGAGNTFVTVISGSPVRSTKGAHPNADGAGNLTTNSTACQLTSGAGASTTSCYVGTTSEGPTTVTVGVSGSTVYRAVVAYPVSSVLPADASVISASMYVVSNTYFSQTIQAYALTQPWTTSSVSWNTSTAGTSWTSPGGTYDSSTPAFSGPSYQITPSSRSDSVNISALVAHWLNAPSTNNGVLLKQQNESISSTAPLQFPSMQVIWSRRPGDDPAGSPQVHKITDQVAASVNMANENITLQGSLLALPGASPSIGLKLGYAMDLDGSLYESFREASLALTINGDGSIRYTSPDAYEQQILHYATGWQSPPGLNVTVTESGADLLTGNYVIRFNSSGLTNYYTYNTVSCGSGCFTPYTRLDSTKDAEGNSIVYQYNATGQISNITDSQGRNFTITYPTTAMSAMPQTLSDTASSRTWTFHYGTYNRLISVDNPTGSSPTPTYGYLSGGYLSTILDPDGNKTSFSDNAWFNSGGAVAYASQAYWGLDSSGSTTSSTSHWIYQPTTTFGAPYTTDPNGGVTHYAVDNQDRITAVMDPLGHSESTTWSPNSNILSQTNSLTAATTYGYDALNNLTSETSAAGVGTASSTSYTYPSPTGTLADYQPMTSKDAQGNSTTYSYNLSNEVATTTSPGSLGTTTNHYQGDSGITCTNAKPGQLCSKVDGIGATTTYGYDSAGNVAIITPPSPLGAISFTYNADGYTKSRTDGRGQTLYYSYDPLGRLTQTSTSATSCTSVNCTKYVYNAEGWVASRVDPSGTTNYSYDSQGRALTMNTPTGNTTYTYDGNSNLTSYQDAGGTVGYRYDAANRLTAAWLPSGSCTATPTFPNSTSCIGFGYDNANRRTTTSYPNGQTITNAFDNAGRETSIAAKNTASTTLASRTYNYVKAGADTDLRQSITDQTGSTTSYVYDARKRVMSATTGAAVSSWTYDNASNRLTSTVSGTTTAFKYNSASELCYMASTNTAACGATPTGGTGYTYNGAGDLTATSASSLSAVAYSAFDQMSSTTASGTATSYGYSDTTSDQRTTSGTSSYANGLLGLTRETAGSTTTEYIRDPSGTLLAMNRDGTISFYTEDALGSVILLTSTTGAIAASYTYDTWGNTSSSVTGVAAQNPWRYASGYTDATGLIKFGTRYYNPTWGRFTQQDPTGQETNAYDYVNCNPVNGVDASGRGSSCVGEILSGIAGFVGLTAGVIAEITLGPETGGATILALALEGEAVAAGYGGSAFLIADGIRTC